jgi:SAM-dependent methyltransferase
MNNHNKFYSYAHAYDIAFDFKNIKNECDFLVSMYEKINSCKPQSFLDLAAGPALHAIEMAKRQISSSAIDLSKEMVEYGISKATKNGVLIDYTQSDIREFNLRRKFDLAGIFMDSTSYLLTNEDFIRHLRSVALHMNSNGLYILEMSHPRDVFSAGASTVNSWDTERDGLKVSLEWGHKDDFFDPITQITNTTVNMKIFTEIYEDQVLETAPQRCFTFNEFKALVLAEGNFELIKVLGAMDLDISFSNEKAAWRMIPILRKKNKFSTH